MINTMGVQPFDFENPSPFLLLEAIEDILNYLNHEIILIDEFAFLNRENISLELDFDGSMRDKQYYTNGLLISGLFEHLDNEKFPDIENKFQLLLKTLSNLLQKKLQNANLSDTHCVFVEADEDYGDVVIGFWRCI